MAPVEAPPCPCFHGSVRLLRTPVPPTRGAGQGPFRVGSPPPQQVTETEPTVSLRHR